MKKIILSVIIIMTILASSCNEAFNAIPTDIMADLMEIYPNIPSASKVYFSSAEEWDSGYLDIDTAASMYNADDKSILRKFEMIDSYAIRIPSGNSVFEIHIFKVRNQSDVKYIAEMCKNRIELWKSNDVIVFDESEEDIINRAEVLVKNNYVFLLSTIDNEAAKMKLGIK